LVEEKPLRPSVVVMQNLQGKGYKKGKNGTHKEWYFVIKMWILSEP
jgi:hypothetical protein